MNTRPHCFAVIGFAPNPTQKEKKHQEREERSRQYGCLADRRVGGGGVGVNCNDKKERDIFMYSLFL
jgi:hypothetical protein